MNYGSLSCISLFFKMKNSSQNLNLWCMNWFVLGVNRLVTLKSWITYFCTVWIDSPVSSAMVNQFMAVQGGFFTDQTIHQSSLTWWIDSCSLFWQKKYDYFNTLTAPSLYVNDFYLITTFPCHFKHQLTRKWWWFRNQTHVRIFGINCLVKILN
jgi:hypothetical protein